MKISFLENYKMDVFRSRAKRRRKRRSKILDANENFKNQDHYYNVPNWDCFP